MKIGSKTGIKKGAGWRTCGFKDSLLSTRRKTLCIFESSSARA